MESYGTDRPDWGPDEGIGTTREPARDRSRQAREKAREMADRAREAAEEQYGARRDEAAGELHGVARALRSAASELDSENLRSGRWISKAAERIDDLARRFEDRDLPDLMREAEGFARRSPAAFLAGSVALGFLASRFLKARPGEARSHEPGEPSVDPSSDDPWVTYAEE